MNLLEYIFGLLRLGLIIFVAAIIVLTLLRAVVSWRSMNPFGWFAFNIKRLTEPFLMPLRDNPIASHARHDIAPILLVILMIVVAAFGLQLLDSVAETIIGIQRGIGYLLDGAGLTGLRYIVGYLLLGLLSLLLTCIILQVLFSWLGIYRNRVARFVYRVSEPVLRPLRRMVPIVGLFDITPLVAYFLVAITSWAVRATFLT
jgi:YggT family protein